MTSFQSLLFLTKEKDEDTINATSPLKLRYGHPFSVGGCSAFESFPSIDLLQLASAIEGVVIYDKLHVVCYTETLSKEPLRAGKQMIEGLPIYSAHGRSCLDCPLGLTFEEILPIYDKVKRLYRSFLAYRRYAGRFCSVVSQCRLEELGFPAQDIYSVGLQALSSISDLATSSYLGLPIHPSITDSLAFETIVAPDKRSISHRIMKAFERSNADQNHLVSTLMGDTAMNVVIPMIFSAVLRECTKPSDIIKVAMQIRSSKGAKAFREWSRSLESTPSRTAMKYAKKELFSICEDFRSEFKRVPLAVLNFGFLSFNVPEKIIPTWLLNGIDNLRGKAHRIFFRWLRKDLECANSIEDSLMKVYGYSRSDVKITLALMRQIYNKTLHGSITDNCIGCSANQCNPLTDGMYFVVHKESKVLHRPTCSSVSKMSVHKMILLDSLRSANAQGFRLCKSCRPI